MSYCMSCDLGNCGRTIPAESKETRSCGLFIVGRNPGEDEDRIGRPFVGVAGQLLDVVLQAAGLIRSEIYITNLCKCFSPNNREPKTQEILTCSSKYLEVEIIAGKPKVVVALSATVISYFTGIKNVSVAMKQKIIKLPERGFVVVPTYHPSALCRQGITVKNFNQKKPTAYIESFVTARKAWEIFKKHGKI